MGEEGKEGEKQEQIGIIPLIIAHFLIGAGIVVIGQRTKNKMEFYGGLAFIFVVISLLIAKFFIFRCDSICEIYGSSMYLMPSCQGCVISNFAFCISGIISLLSWIYIIIRLFLLRNEGYPIKVI